MTSLPIEERLLHYFLAMGAQQAETTQSTPGGLSLVLGTEKIHVVILKNDAFAQRNKIIESILGLVSLRTPSTQLYLAAPKLLGAIIDAAVFRSYGIGLILFDERRIEEAVAPQALQAPQQTQTANGSDPALITELTTLKSMYLEMQRNIARLSEDLKSIKETFGRTPNAGTFDTSRPAPQPTILPPDSLFPGQGTHGDQLPSFFSNNPWIDVLSKRGRAEGESIAA